jgi:hypothetical protein
MNARNVFFLVLFSPILGLAFSFVATILAAEVGLRKPPISVLIARTVSYAAAGAVLSLGATIVWMVWYEWSTGFDAGNGPLFWIFFAGPISATLGELVALVRWWIQAPVATGSPGDRPN